MPFCRSRRASTPKGKAFTAAPLVAMVGTTTLPCGQRVACITRAVVLTADRPIKDCDTCRRGRYCLPAQTDTPARARCALRLTSVMPNCVAFTVHCVFHPRPSSALLARRWRAATGSGSSWSSESRSWASRWGKPQRGHMQELGDGGVGEQVGVVVGGVREAGSGGGWRGVRVGGAPQMARRPIAALPPQSPKLSHAAYVPVHFT